jgi:hypothetical protein
MILEYNEIKEEEVIKSKCSSKLSAMNLVQVAALSQVGQKSKWKSGRLPRTRGWLIYIIELVAHVTNNKSMTYLFLQLIASWLILATYTPYPTLFLFPSYHSSRTPKALSFLSF